MSRDTVADALAWCDYGDSPDDVERDLRLRHADNLLATGAVIDVEDLLYGEQSDVWHALGCVLPQRGWKPLVYFFDRSEARLCWAPRGATRDEVEADAVPRIDINWGHGSNSEIIWNPIEDHSVLGEYENAEATYFGTLVGFIAWLDAAI